MLYFHGTGCFTVSITALFLAEARHCVRILPNTILQAPTIIQSWLPSLVNKFMILIFPAIPKCYLGDMSVEMPLSFTTSSQEISRFSPHLPCGFTGHFCLSKHSIAPSISMVFHQSSLYHDANCLSGCSEFHQGLNKNTRFPLATFPGFLTVQWPPAIAKKPPKVMRRGFWRVS